MAESTTRARRAAPLPPEERRCAIVDAVVPLLMEHGADVTTRQIARAAGVAEGTLFNVFRDKDELLAAAVEAAVDPSRFEHAIAEAAAGDDRGSRLAAIIGVLQDRSIAMFRLLVAVGHAPGRKPGPIPVSAALIDYFRTAELDLRVGPEDAARILRSIAFAESHPAFAEPPTEPAEIAELFLHGVHIRSTTGEDRP